MSQLNHEVTVSTDTFAKFINRQHRIDNGENVTTLLLRDSRFNAEFKEYRLIGQAHYEFIRHDGEVLKFSAQDAIGAFREPNALPKGNGKIDDGVDGKGGDVSRKKSDTSSENLKYLQTPESYLNSSMIAPDLPELYSRLISFSDKNTKAELLSFVQNLASEIVPYEVSVTYGEMLEKESTVRALEKFGFTFGPNSHAVTKDGRHIYKGTISYDDRRTYMKEIALIAINQKAIPKENPETLEITYEVTFELA